MARVKTNLIRSSDLHFLCVGTLAATKGGTIASAVVASGHTMGQAWMRCKQKCGKAECELYIVYASESNDIHVDSSGHVKSSTPVMRLTKVNRLGRLIGN